jgi:hypothetical protein
LRQSVMAPIPPQGTLYHPDRVGRVQHAKDAAAVVKKNMSDVKSKIDVQSNGDAPQPSLKGTAVFSKQKLNELASDESNKVYDFVYDKPQRVLPMKEVRLKLLAIRGLVVTNTKTNPGWKWADHKRYIRDNHPQLFELARTHPKMFDVASHPQADYARDFSPMLMQIDFFQRMQDGKLTKEEATVAITKKLQEHFLLEPGKTKDDTTPWGVSERPG